MTHRVESNRREFLAASSSTAGLLLVRPETAFGSQANSAVELGLIGAGGRGNWIGDFWAASGRFGAASAASAASGQPE